jgi:hypothetical protein
VPFLPVRVLIPWPRRPSFPGQTIATDSCESQQLPALLPLADLASSFPRIGRRSVVQSFISRSTPERLALFTLLILLILLIGRIVDSRKHHCFCAPRLDDRTSSQTFSSDRRSIYRRETRDKCITSHWKRCSYPLFEEFLHDPRGIVQQEIDGDILLGKSLPEGENIFPHWA